jgi:fatty-acyl-CoA synthase
MDFSITPPDAAAPPIAWLDRDFAAYHAGMRGKKTACIEFHTGRRITYGELELRVRRATVALDAICGDLRGAPVGLLARNSIDYLVFILACFRTGAILQPLNWRLSAAELEVILTDAEPVLVVHEDEFAAVCREALTTLTTCRIVTKDAFFAEAAKGENPEARFAVVDEHSPQFLLYTSGTTGKPKGAILSRINAYWQAFNFASCADVSPDSMMLCDAPMFHVVGLLAVCWCTVQRGGTFAISDRFVPAETLGRLLDEEVGATHYFGVPQIARMLLDDPAYRPRALTRLVGFFLGGAPMPLDLTERMLAEGIKVCNGFGMTECGAIMHVPLDLDIIRAKAASTGLPVPAMQVRIVDGEGNTVPDGVQGELVMRGPAVTRGYWKRPDANISAFFGDWFRSGDIGLRDGDGFFYVLDRSKDMYISGGENVYPAEVESAILRLPEVAEVAVVGVADERWGEVGCAYVVLREGRDIEAAELISACAQWLAPYKRPKHVRFIDAIPRNAGGKAQKTILRQRLL